MSDRHGWRKDGDEPAVTGKGAAGSESDYTDSDEEQGDDPHDERDVVLSAPLSDAPQSLAEAEAQLRLHERQAVLLKRQVARLQAAARQAPAVRPGVSPPSPSSLRCVLCQAAVASAPSLVPRRKAAQTLGHKGPTPLQHLAPGAGRRPSRERVRSDAG